MGSASAKGGTPPIKIELQMHMINRDITYYPKGKIFSQVFSWLKPAGHFFFAAYSPRDERMGKLKGDLNRKLETEFTIYLEAQSFYENRLQDCGFVIKSTELVEATGSYQAELEVLEVNREFILMIAEKPA